MGRKFANILETVGNTPVVRIGKLAPPDVNLFVKIGVPRAASRAPIAVAIVIWAEWGRWGVSPTS